MTADQRLEQLLGDLLVDGAPPHAPGLLRSHIVYTTSRARPRSRWLADIKERPMRLHNGVAAGSPALRLAYLVILTFILTVVATGTVVGAASLLPGPATIVVAPDGSGDYVTITEAVAAAEDGDTVLVRPGTYVESLLITKDITVRGDGARDSITIQAPATGPTSPIEMDGIEQDPYAIRFEGSRAVLSGLSFTGRRSEVFASGGAPTLEDLVFDGVGVAYAGGTSFIGNSIVINDGSTATVRRNSLADGGPIGIYDLSVVLVEGNTLTGGPHIFGFPGDGAVIRSNVINGTNVRGVGIFNASAVTIGDNTITDPGQSGIEPGDGPAVVSGNTVEGATEYGIFTAAESTIRANHLRHNNAGILVESSDPTIGDNDIQGNSTGIKVLAGSPRINGNTFCGNDTDLDVPDGSTLTLDGNTICAAPPSAEP